ncbi:hypothetical protein [Amycolatopsis kentuckyensis]|uniref:hypothetical protein n=1 Tax=Amycolatopsis kentuckyensis TaxID=218823 RepID=UPI00356B02A4
MPAALGHGQFEVGAGPGCGAQQDGAAVADASGQPARELRLYAMGGDGAEHDQVEAIDQGGEDGDELGAGVGNQGEAVEVDAEFCGGGDTEVGYAGDRGPRPGPGRLG